MSVILFIFLACLMCSFVNAVFTQEHDGYVVGFVAGTFIQVALNFL